MEILSYILSLFAGLALGVIYFGGLWFTVIKINASASPGWWVFGSLILRMTLLMLSFYALIQFHWSYLAVAFLGFMVARGMILNRKGKVTISAGD